MRLESRQLVFIAAVTCVSAAAILLVRYADLDFEADRPSIDLALVQEMLNSGTQNSRYRLITNSVMTGLCWRTDDGGREGVFRDVNAGMAHWRDRAPETADRRMPAGSPPALPDNDKTVSYAMLSDQLDRLSFEATAYRQSGRSVQVMGELLIGGRSREVTLSMRMPPNQPGSDENTHMIELSASTGLAAEDLGTFPLAYNAKTLNLCIAMQAVKESALPDSHGDKPLMLSHYYQ